MSKNSPARWLLLLALTACGEERTVGLREVSGSGVRGQAWLGDALTKSLFFRVDAKIELEGYAPPMRAIVKAGRCDRPGEPLGHQIMVYAPGEEGAPGVLLSEGRVADLAGRAIIVVFAGDAGESATVACGEL